MRIFNPFRFLTQTAATMLRALPSWWRVQRKSFAGVKWDKDSCAQCGYLLKVPDATTCPECGSDLASQKRVSIAQSRMVSIVIVLLAPLIYLAFIGHPHYAEWCDDNVNWRFDPQISTITWGDGVDSGGDQGVAWIRVVTEEPPRWSFKAHSYSSTAYLSLNTAGPGVEIQGEYFPSEEREEIHLRFDAASGEVHAFAARQFSFFHDFFYPERFLERAEEDGVNTSLEGLAEWMVPVLERNFVAESEDAVDAVIGLLSFFSACVEEDRRPSDTLSEFVMPDTVLVGFEPRVFPRSEWDDPGVLLQTVLYAVYGTAALIVYLLLSAIVIRITKTGPTNGRSQP